MARSAAAVRRCTPSSDRSRTWKGPESPAFAVLGNGASPPQGYRGRGGGRPRPTRSPDLRFILKILAMYGSAAGTDAVLAPCGRAGADPHMWNVILRAYTSSPAASASRRGTRRPIPSGIPRLSLLDAANAAHIDGVDDLTPSTPPPACVASNVALGSGRRAFQLRHQRGARAAVVNPPRTRCPAPPRARTRQPLRPDGGRLGGGPARARAGGRSPRRACLDVDCPGERDATWKNWARRTPSPPRRNEPGFRARAEFAEWLAHRNELGRPARSGNRRPLGSSLAPGAGPEPPRRIQYR